MTRSIVAFATLLATSSIFANAAVSQEDADWSEQPLEHANATSVVQQVPGYDYRKKYPGESVKGWTLSYAVTNRQRNASSAWTASALWLKPPSSLIEFDTDESWGMCGERLYLVAKSDDQTVDPQCRGVVSDSCQKALLELVRDSELCFGKIAMPEECSEDFKNAENEEIDADGTFAGISFRDDTNHRPDNFTLYDALLRRIVVSVIGFRPNTFEFSEEELKKAKHIPGFLSCLRATEIKEGSRTLDGGKASGDKDKDENKESDDGESESGKDEGESETDQGKDSQSQDGQGSAENKEDPPQGAASSIRSAMNGIAALMVSLLVATVF